MVEQKPSLKLAAAACAIVALLAAACVSTMSAPVQIKAMDWLDPTTDPVVALTTQPATCLRTRSEKVRAGEALFNSPLLLGGQAAKAGLSCGSCHQNGRGNRNFVFTGISGTPGTADVTHGLLGPTRADEIFNPVMIPDLATLEGRTRIDRDTPGMLEAFLKAQIIEEFEGTEPTAPLIDALSTYIRALDDQNCTPDTREPISWQHEIERIMAGLYILERIDQTDIAAARAYGLAIRASLGRLHARYSGAPAIQEALEQISQMVNAEMPILEIRLRLDALQPDLANQADNSLYNPVRLETALAVGTD